MRRIVAAMLGVAAAAAPAPAASTVMNSPYVVEQRITRWELSEDGTGTVQMRARFRIENEGGVQALGQILEPYLVGRSRLQVRSLSVRHQDGSVSELRPENARDLPAPVTAAFPVYSDLHVLHITPPALRPGDILELELLNELVQPDAPGHFGVQHTFVRSTIVESEVLEVLVPNARSVKLRTADGLEPVIESVADSRLYRWSHEQDSVDVEEPTWTDPRALVDRPDIELTSFPDWQSVGDWYAGLALERARTDQQIRRKSEELTAGLTDDRERIAAIYDFVRRSVRYLGLQFGLSRYQPHTAAETLDNGYGDCKDKHTLLAALLAAAGYEAWPVLVGVLREPTPEVPGPLQFDHLITAVQLNGETLWLDSTDVVNPFGYLSIAMRGKRALLVQPQGRSRLVGLPERLPFPAFETTRLAGRVDRDGMLDGVVTYETRGDGEPIIRTAFLNTAGDQRIELGKRMLETLALDAELVSIETSDPADTRQPLRATMKIRAEDFVSPFTQDQEVTLPSIAGNLSNLEEADEDILFGKPARFTVEVDLTFPDGTRVEPPLPVALEREFATLRSQFDVHDSRLTGTRVLDVVVGRLVPGQKNAYEQFRAAAESDGEQTLGLTFPEGVLADTREIQDADRLHRAGKDAYSRNDYATAIGLLQRATVLEPEHEDAWEELGRTLVQAGRANEAVGAMRRQLEVTPHHATIRSNLGWALEEAGDKEAAVEAYREQLQVDPSDEYSTERLGRLLWSFEKYEESLPYLRRAARQDPDDTALVWLLADSELHTGDAERAEALLEPLRSTGDSASITDALSNLAKHGHWTLLDPLLHRLEELAPEAAWTWDFKGLYAKASGRDDEARSAFDRVLELEPDNADARLELAAALSRLDRHAEAIPNYRKYLEQRPDDLDARFWLGESLFLNGEAEASIREFEAIVATRPDDFKGWAGLARARLASGDIVGAGDAAEHASRAAPEDAQAKLGLAELYALSGRAAEAKSLVLALYETRQTNGVPCARPEAVSSRVPRRAGPGRVPLPPSGARSRRCGRAVACRPRRRGA